MRAAAWMGVAGLTASLLIGCEAPAPARPGMSVLILPGATRAEAIDATRAALQEFDFRVQTEDDEHGYLRSFPVEETIAGGTGRISDPLIQTPNQVRNVAEAYVEEADEGTMVRLAVVRERRDTATRRAFRREREDVDFPADTPIDQEGGTSPEQYESWTRIGRDRQMENNILHSVEEHLAAAHP